MLSKCRRSFCNLIIEIWKTRKICDYKRYDTTKLILIFIRVNYTKWQTKRNKLRLWLCGRTIDTISTNVSPIEKDNVQKFTKNAACFTVYSSMVWRSFIQSTIQIQLMVFSSWTGFNAMTFGTWFYCCWIWWWWTTLLICCLNKRYLKQMKRVH